MILIEKWIRQLTYIKKELNSKKVNKITQGKTLCDFAGERKDSGNLHLFEVADRMNL